MFTLLQVYWLRGALNILHFASSVRRVCFDAEFLFCWFPISVFIKDSLKYIWMCSKSKYKLHKNKYTLKRYLFQPHLTYNVYNIGTATQHIISPWTEKNFWKTYFGCTLPVLVKGTGSKWHFLFYNLQHQTPAQGLCSSFYHKPEVWMKSCAEVWQISLCHLEPPKHQVNNWTSKVPSQFFSDSL